MTTWTADQVRAFLDHTAEHRLHAAFVLLATTGMRRGECLGLRWSDVDMNAGRVSISQTVIMVHHDLQVGHGKQHGNAAPSHSTPRLLPRFGSTANGRLPSGC
jgi:integrase